MTRKRVLLAVAAVAAVVVVAVVSVGSWLVLRKPTLGRLETATGVHIKTVDTAPPAAKVIPAAEHAGPCWDSFGGGPLRDLSRPTIDLGVPGHSAWATGLGGLMEYPPSYCDGRLYVNLEKGETLAIDAATGRVLWTAQGGRLKRPRPRRSPARG